MAIATNSQSDDGIKTAIIQKYKGLFKNNKTIKETQVKITVKPGIQPIFQKAKPILVHLQEDLFREINKLQEGGYIKRRENFLKNTITSAAVITVKQDKSVKIALKY